MAAIIVALLSYIPLVPGIVTSIEQLIARGKQTGELSAADADALTSLANSLFAQYSQPAPPPPGA